MQYGFIIPNGDTQTFPELAAEAEAAGWDGIFIKSRRKTPWLQLWGYKPRRSPAGYA